MFAFCITHAELRSLATLAHAASRDDITPVITGIHVESMLNGFTAAATDRYRVAELAVTYSTENGRYGSKPINRDAGFSTDELVDVNSEFTVILPVPLITRAVKALPRKPINDRAASLAIIIAEDSITIRDQWHGIAFTDRAIKGNFPPVTRLFPDNVDSMIPAANGVCLKAAFLATLDKLRLPDYEREATWCMRTDTDEQSTSRKPKPVLFTIDNESGTLRYLIQPNMKLR